MRQCRHIWRTTGVEFTPPPNLASVSAGGPGVVDKILFGITNVTQTCETCLRVRVETAPGKVAVEVDQS